MLLTQRQKEVLAFIQRQADSRGAPPTLQQIADHFGFRPSAAHKHVRLIGQAGYLQVRPNEARGIRLAGAPAKSRARSERLELPVLGRVAAGVPIGADAGVERHLQLDPALFSTKPDYLLRVVGDSMHDDGILDGDLVAVKRTQEARDGQVVVARIDGELTIKRFEHDGTRIRLLPRNPAYAPITIPRGSDFAIEGLYCGLVRPG
ncbi:MAG: transcriptional repressor LexA [Luteimonas sp.]